MMGTEFSSDGGMDQPVKIPPHLDERKNMKLSAEEQLEDVALDTYRKPKKSEETEPGAVDSKGTAIAAKHHYEDNDEDHVTIEVEEDKTDHHIIPQDLPWRTWFMISLGLGLLTGPVALLLLFWQPTRRDRKTIWSVIFGFVCALLIWATIVLVAIFLVDDDNI